MGSRKAYLPHGGDYKPRHCECGWCEGLLEESRLLEPPEDLLSFSLADGHPLTVPRDRILPVGLHKRSVAAQKGPTLSTKPIPAVADKIALRPEEDHRAAVALLLVSTAWNVLAVCHLPSFLLSPRQFQPLGVALGQFGTETQLRGVCLFEDT
jgi:hypothetical protein